MFLGTAYIEFERKRWKNRETWSKGTSWWPRTSRSSRNNGKFQLWYLLFQFLRFAFFSLCFLPEVRWNLGNLSTLANSLDCQFSRWKRLRMWFIKWVSWAIQPALACSKLATTKKCEIGSKLSTKTPERPQWRRSGVFIVNFEQISRIVLLFPMLTLIKLMAVGRLNSNWITRKHKFSDTDWNILIAWLIFTHFGDTKAKQNLMPCFHVFMD